MSVWLDFWTIHSDVIRGAFVLLVWVLAGAALTALITWRLTLRHAYRQANATLKQRNVELTIENRGLRETNERQWKEIERLTHVQSTAVAAARSVQGVAKE